jgi:hypothetical protein
MHWLADECVHRVIVENLRKAGHDVTFVTELFPSSPDESLYSFAAQQNCILLTHDLGFGEFAFHWQFPRTAGVVMFRLRISAVAFQWRRLQAVLDTPEVLTGRLTIIEDARLRARPFK